MSFVPPVYDPKTGIVMLKGRDEILAYYEQFRPQQMESFAQFVLSKGYGATTPNGKRNSAGIKVSESWQECGKRLFGERFVPVMARAIRDHNARHEAPRQTEPIPDPEF